MTLSKRMAGLLASLATSGFLHANGRQELDVLATRFNIGSMALYGGETSCPSHLSALVLRYGFDWLTRDQITFQFLGSYQTPATATIPVDTHSRYLYTAPITFKQDGCALGLQARWHHGAEWGLGPEICLEHLNKPGLSATQIRPWLTARLGWALPVPALTYLAGLEGAWALKGSRKDGTWETDNLMQPIYVLTPGSGLLQNAPNRGFSFYLGARF